MNGIRAFIAIEIDEKNRSQLLSLISRLKEAKADVKWAESSAMHFTLKFLGNIDKSLIEKLKISLNDISKKFPVFDIHLSGISAFPNLKSPRVFWVGLDKGSSQVCDIQKEIEEKLQSFGFKKEERGFRPHLTLGRIRSNKFLETLKLFLKNIEFQGETSSEAKGIVLFQSNLTPQGPIYTKLHEANLLKKT